MLLTIPFFKKAENAANNCFLKRPKHVANNLFLKKAEICC
jgi:hypothetical protein